MNENLDLMKILKGCPKGTEFYHAGYGRIVYFDRIILNSDCPIRCLLDNCRPCYYNIAVTKKGAINALYEGECLLFPSKDQRDWSKFTAPWLKKERFDPKTLNPFDKVLSKYDGGCWSANLFSHIEEENNKYHGTCSFVCNGSLVKFCIPYNDDTKHLVGTTDKAPDFYRYWED